MTKSRGTLLALMVFLMGVLWIAPLLTSSTPVLAQMPPALATPRPTSPAVPPAPASSVLPSQSPTPSAAAPLQQVSNVTAAAADRGSAPPLAPSWWSNQNAMTISVVVLAFGGVTILIAAYLIRGERDGLVILRILGTISIITFAVFLIVAGYSDQQIAPAMGLLGTIAGYLLGKDQARPREQNPQTPAP